MKKTISIILAAALMMSLTSCKNKTKVSPSPSPAASAAASPAASAANTAEPADQSTDMPANTAETPATNPPLNGGSLNENNTVGVSEKNDIVTVTYPKDFLPPDTNVEITDEMKEQGYQSVSKNDDGTVTYTLTKEGYDNLKNKMKDTVIDYFKNVESDENFKSIKKIDYEDDFSVITITVDQKAFEQSLDVTASRAIYMLVSGYKIFCGEEPDKAKVTVVYKDQGSKNEISRTIYPDALS